ncbi:MAG: GWxTD domain-containing protein [Saprospiraceae bacterium]|nr:GWxTD domain-containing protein [Saprospiraceae bacterium]
MFHRILSLFFVLNCCTSSLLSQVHAYIQSTVFYQDENPYVELFYIMSIDEASQSSHIALQILVKQNNEYVKALKYNFNTQQSKKHHPILHIERIILPIGSYEIESVFNHSNSIETEHRLLNPVEIKPKNASINISEIQLCSTLKNTLDSTYKYQKNGIQYEPQLFNTYEPQDRLMQFYYETYSNQEQKESLIHHYIIEKIDTLLHRTKVIDWYKKKEIKRYNPVIITQDISNLPSGNYILRIELLKMDKSMVTKTEIGFIRINPFWDRFVDVYYEETASRRFFETLPNDTAQYMLKAIKPNVPSTDMPILNYLKKNGNIAEIKLYLYDFFRKASNDASSPSKYFEYLNTALAVDTRFNSGFGKGFETDRGVIYMRYGNPSEIIPVDQDNGAFPYEIWLYNKIVKTNQVNVKFLFYNPDLAGGDFRLLHSTARGERNNPRWEPELYKRVQSEIIQNDGIDDTKVQSNFHRRAREYFDN